MSRLQAVTLGVLLLVAAGFGLAWGLRAVPPGETEMIEAAAARYVAQTGGVPTDCAGRPAAVAGVRMVVTCGTDWAVALDRWGRVVEARTMGSDT